MNKYLKLLAFIIMPMVVIGQSLFAGVTPPASPSPARRSQSEVTELQYELIATKARTKKGADVRNQLAFLLFQGEIEQNVLTFDSAATQLIHVLKAHGAHTLAGARARCLLAVARIRGLVNHEIVQFRQIVDYLNEVIAEHQINTIPGAAARINLAAMRAQAQIADNVMTRDVAAQLTRDAIVAATEAGLTIDFEAAQQNLRLLEGEAVEPANKRLKGEGEAEGAVLAEPTEPVRTEPDVMQFRFGGEIPILDELHETSSNLEFVMDGFPVYDDNGIDDSLDGLELGEIGDLPEEFFEHPPRDNTPVQPLPVAPAMIMAPPLPVAPTIIMAPTVLSYLLSSASKNTQ